MGGISLDSFRTMASGVGGFESVAVETDERTHEMTLVGRKVQTTQAVNVRTREMLVSLMAADLRESFGVNDVSIDDFVKNLRKELLGKHATENLARKDGLTKAFDLFDTFKVKKLTERKFIQGTATAQRNYTYKSLAFDHQFAEETRLAGAKFEAPLKPLLSDKSSKDLELSGYKKRIGEPIEKEHAAALKKLNDFVANKLRPLASMLSFESQANIQAAEKMLNTAMATGADELRGMEKFSAESLKGNLEKATEEAEALKKALERHGVNVDGAMQRPGGTSAKVGVAQILNELKTLENNLDKAKSNLDFWEYITTAEAGVSPEALAERGWAGPRFVEVAHKLNELKTAQRETEDKYNVLEDIQGKIKNGETFEIPERFSGQKWLQSAIGQLRTAYDGLVAANDREKEWKKLRDSIDGDRPPVVQEKKRSWKNAVASEMKTLKDAIVVAGNRQNSAKQYYDSNLEKFKEGWKDVDEAYKRLQTEVYMSGKSSSSRLKTLCKLTGVKISDKTFARFYNERGDAVRQTALALIGGSNGKLQPQQAILQAIRTLRDVELRAGKSKGAGAALNETDKQLVDFLVNQSKNPETVKEFLKNNAELRMGINYQLMGGLKLLANLPGTDRSVTLSIPVSANGKKQENITLIQSTDDSLKFTYKGHTYELAIKAKDLYASLMSTRIVGEFNPASYDSVSSDADANIRQAHENWPGTVDQKLVVDHIDEMLRALRECNNKDIDAYGAAPHFNGNMPSLDARGSRTVKIFGLFDTGRTETFLRTYFNQQIKQCKNPISKWFERRKAAFMGVKLESGSAKSGENTLFENSALFLHQLRLLAKNANYIISRFDLSSEANAKKGEYDVAEDACNEFNRITQFTLHPKAEGERFTCDQHLSSIKGALVLYYKAFKKAEEAGRLKEFFEKITAGACFNGCSTNIAQYAGELGVLDLDFTSMAEFSAEPSVKQEKTAARPAGKPVFAQSPAAEWLNGAMERAKESDKARAEVQSSLDNVQTQPRNQSLADVPKQEAPAQPAAAQPKIQPPQNPQPAAAQPKIQKPNDVKNREAPASAVAQGNPNQVPRQRKNGVLEISPALKKNLHRQPENLFDYIKSELVALDKTVNPPGTSNPKTFSWGEVKPILEARGQEIVKEKLNILWNWCLQGGTKQLNDFKSKTTDKEREQWQQSLATAVRKNNLSALWISKYVDFQKGELRIDLVKSDYAAYLQMFKNGVSERPAVPGAQQTLEDVVVANVKKQLNLECVDADGKCQTLNAADPGFLASAEKSLKSCGLIMDDGRLLPFPHADDVAKVWSPAEAPKPDKDALVREFERKKAVGKPALPPNVTETLHTNNETLNAYLQVEIRNLYTTFNPPGTEKPKVFSWNEFKEFMKERLDGINADQMENAARAKYKELKERPGTLHKKMSDANTALILMGRCGVWGKDWLGNLLSIEKDSDRRSEMKKLVKGGDQRNWALMFVDNEGQLKKEFESSFSLYESVKDWLSRFRSSDAPTCRKMVDSIRESGDPLLPYLTEFVDMGTATLKKNVFSAEGEVEFSPDDQQRLGKEAGLAYLKAKVDQFAANQRKILREASTELPKLAQTDYLKSEVEKARQNARLKLFCGLETLSDFKSKNANGLGNLKFEAEDFVSGWPLPYVEYSSPDFWNLVEHVLIADRILKTDDVREFMRGGLGVVMQFPRMLDGSLVKDADRIQRVSPSGKKIGTWEYYDPAVHGTEFIKVLNREGKVAWRSLDGRYEAMSKGESHVKEVANLDGDVEIKKGDLRVPVEDADT